MRHVFHPVGTCSTEIEIEVREGVVAYLSFTGGCRGNLEGLSRLVIGRRVDQVISLLDGILCQNGTSCPDQLARALARLERESKSS